jgi:microcystin-dependent protein
MSTPFLGEIKIVAFGFAPKGWAQCNGQLLPINQNQPLFALLGTTYGGDGGLTFALPDLRARTPMHFAVHTQGEAGGEPAHTLTVSEMAAHTHAVQASTAATNGIDQPFDNFLGGGNNVYHSPAGVQLTTLVPDTITTNGGSQAHENQQPYLVLNFCIALSGIFPSRN